MLYNTPKSLIFRGALNVNRLRGSLEKLSTIGGADGGKLMLLFFGGGEDLVYLRGRYASPHQESADGEGKFVYQP